MGSREDKKRAANGAVGSQVAALPVRVADDGTLEVLMVTSRDTGRWIVPKGWGMEGREPWQAARIEALEEAGAEGPIAPEPLGEYRYGKVLDDGTSLPCEVQVYPMLVEGLRKRWRERKERKRRWFATSEAAERVAEPELAKMLRRIGRKGRRRALVQSFARER